MQEFGITYLLPSLPIFPIAAPGNDAELQNAISATNAAWVAARAGQWGAVFNGLTLCATVYAAWLALKVWKPEVVGRAAHTALVTARSELVTVRLYADRFFEDGRRASPIPVGVNRNYQTLEVACEKMELALVPISPKWTTKEKRIYADFKAEARILRLLNEQYQSVPFGMPMRVPLDDRQTETRYRGLEKDEVKAQFDQVTRKFRDPVAEQRWTAALEAMSRVLDSKIKRF
jgi:hypothetical protein